MALKGIIWGFDGVIADSFPDVFEWLRKVCGIFNKQFIYNNTEDFRRDLPEPVFPAMYELLGFDWGRDREIILNYYNEHKKHARIHPVKGIESVIRELDAAGYRQCIASSNANEEIERRLQEYGIKDFFAAVVANEDLPVAHNEPKYKPHPDCLLICLERLGMSPWECVYIGDQVSDIKAARNVKAVGAGNLPVIAVSYGYCTWQKLKAEKPDYPKESPIETPEDLLEIIRHI